ncbi:hypothetical protein [Deinococcus fonticola]|nr:hypothetical protein [Deinococcus fonticola]
MPLKELLIYLAYLMTLITAIFAAASGFQSVLMRWWSLSGVE